MSLKDSLETINDSTVSTFFDVGGYKPCIKKVDNGNFLCEELIQLLKERCEIERSYSEALKDWSKKWIKIIDKGHEYHSIADALKCICKEGSESGTIHSELRENILTNIVRKVKDWQKTNYHKTMMGLKESKRFEDGFKQAQKSWAEDFKKTKHAKKKYFTACKAEHSASSAKAQSDVLGYTQSQISKLDQKVAKAENDKIKYRNNYEVALNDLTNMIARYRDFMIFEYEKFAKFEEHRLDFFHSIFGQLATILDASTNSNYKQVYLNLHGGINMVDITSDLETFYYTSGPGVNHSWPTFQEWSPIVQETFSNKTKVVATHDASACVANGNTGSYIRRDSEANLISSKKTSLEEVNNRHQTVAQVNHEHTVDNEFEVTNPFSESSDDLDETNPFNEDFVDAEGKSGTLTITKPREENNEVSDNATCNSSQQSLEMHSTDDYMDSVKERCKYWPGIPVKALFDYHAVEPDELTLTKGEEFLKLNDVDAQGWCFGRVDDVFGHYPAQYAEDL